MDKLFSYVDASLKGKISFHEFIAASIDKEKLLSQKNLEQAFAILDTEGDGVITKNELKTILGEELVEEHVWDDMISQIDTRGEGTINLEDFIASMLKMID